jgi:hypothetical protein
VPKYVGASTEAYHRVFELAKTHTDAEIADELNARGFLTMKQKPWSARRVMDFRVSNAIPSGLTASPTMRLPDTDYISSSEAAERLGVDQSRIQTWFRWGVLRTRQTLLPGVRLMCESESEVEECRSRPDTQHVVRDCARSSQHR